MKRTATNVAAAACIVTAAAIFFGAAPPNAAAQSLLTVEGTEFVLRTADGRVLRSAVLVGTTLHIKNGSRDTDVVIESVAEDQDAIGGRLLLHHFLVKDEGGVREMCTPDAEGRRLGFPVPDGHDGFELTCTSGAIGKCVRWGYRPWDERTGGPPLRALHQACVHMARADYGGDGRATTREGIRIHLCDRFGIRPCAGAPASLSFEAAWGSDGAICVARPRVPDNISLAELARHYPRLKSRVGPAACRERDLKHDPAALLFNRSSVERPLLDKSAHWLAAQQLFDKSVLSH